MNARSVVAVILTATICLSILAPIAARLAGLVNGPLPDAIIASLTDLLKVALGAVVGWLAAGEHLKPPDAP